MQIRGTVRFPRAFRHKKVMPPSAGSALDLTQEEALYWLALRMTPGLGTRRAGHLIDISRTPGAVLRASRSELEAVGLGAAVAQSLASGCAFEDAASQQEKLAEAGATLGRSEEHTS